MGNTFKKRTNTKKIQELLEDYAYSMNSLNFYYELKTYDFPNLDNAFHGFRPGVYIISGKKSVGKTSLMISLITSFLLNKNTNAAIGLFTPCMSKELFSERLVSHQTQIPLDRIVNGFVEKDEMIRIRKLNKLLQDKAFFINDSGYLGFQELIECSQNFAKKNKVQIIFIDELQQLDDGTSRAPHERLESILIRIKELSLEVNLPIIVLTQAEDLNQFNLPGLSSIAQLKNPEVIDVFMILKRKMLFNIVGNSKYPKGLTYLHIRENKFGKKRSIKLIGDLSIQKFVELK